MGLAYILPADLVVILSKLSKKDAITKIRAVEDLVSWVKDVDNREGGQDSISMAIPVWVGFTWDYFKYIKLIKINSCSYII